MRFAMRLFQKFNPKRDFLLFGIYAWASIASLMADTMANKPIIGIDGLNNMAQVWKSVNPITSNYEIRGNFGNAFTLPESVITDSTVVNIPSCPFLATSSSNNATTSAVAVWIAIDRNTNYALVQATIATNSGWNTSPITLSNTDGTETPNYDFRAAISFDGLLITVNWSAFMTSSNSTVIRTAISRDGGMTWTTQNSSL